MSPELKQAHAKIDTLLNGHCQVYLLLSCCPCEGRISGIVDSPNAVATLAVPTAIFDQVNTSPIFKANSIFTTLLYDARLLLNITRSIKFARLQYDACLLLKITRSINSPHCYMMHADCLKSREQIIRFIKIVTFPLKTIGSFLNPQHFMTMQTLCYNVLSLCRIFVRKPARCQLDPG